MKLKKAGIITKIVIIALLVYGLVTLAVLMGKINDVNAEKDLLRQEEDGRFETIRRDIESLDEFETRLSENVQFLLDAALGLIQIEQNNVFRVLTVVSVVGVPPTLIASMYGMNFKHMPELDWAYGYPYALGLILLSALAPILYFRIRGWF